MFLDPRVLIMFAANVLLLHLMQMVDSALTPWSLYLFLLGPMVVLPALYLRPRVYFPCLLLSGLWVDAALPSVYGLFTIAFLVAGAWIGCLRVRFRAEHNYHPALLAHVVNAGLLLVLVLSEAGRGEGLSAVGLPVVVTWLLSHLVLLVVAPWFFELQRCLFELCRLDTEPEDYPVR